jgi:hypothetical protein
MSMTRRQGKHREILEGGESEFRLLAYDPWEMPPPQCPPLVEIKCESPILLTYSEVSHINILQNVRGLGCHNRRFTSTILLCLGDSAKTLNYTDTTSIKFLS